MDYENLIKILFELVYHTLTMAKLDHGQQNSSILRQTRLSFGGSFNTNFGYFRLLGAPLRINTIHPIQEIIPSSLGLEQKNNSS